jgi:hypothetical protein
MRGRWLVGQRGLCAVLNSALHTPEAVRKQLKSLVVRTPMAESVSCRDSDMSFHAGQETRAGERLPDEGVRAGKRRIEPRRRDFACTHARRRSAFLRRSGHTVLLQP